MELHISDTLRYKLWLKQTSLKYDPKEMMSPSVIGAVLQVADD